MLESSVLAVEFKPLLLDQQEFELIVYGYQKKTIAKGEFLIKANTVVQHYYLVESGFLRSFVIDLKGNEVTTNFYAKGSMVLEETSFFLKTHTKENVQAVEDTVVWQKDYATFQNHFNLSEKYREWGRAHLSKNFFVFKQRSLALLTETASKRYSDLLKQNPEIIKKASLKHIASFLGVTDTSLSRIRKEITK